MGFDVLATDRTWLPLHHTLVWSLEWELEEEARGEISQCRWKQRSAGCL